MEGAVGGSGSTDRLTFDLNDAVNVQVDAGTVRATNGSRGLDFRGNGFEFVQTGDADDHFIFEDNSFFNGTLSVGDGDDTLDYSDISSPVTIDLETGTRTETDDGELLLIRVGSATGAGSVEDFEIAKGGSGDDRLSGTQGDNELFGGPGNDILDGLDGQDALDGGNGGDLCLNGEELIDCETLDIVAVGVAPNFDLGGIDYTFDIPGLPVPERFWIDFYWSASGGLNPNLGKAIDSGVSIPEGTRAEEGPFTFWLPAHLMNDVPPGATHLVMIVDEDGSIAEEIEENNDAAMALNLVKPRVEMIGPPPSPLQNQLYEVHLQISNDNYLDVTYRFTEWREELSDDTHRVHQIVLEQDVDSGPSEGISIRVPAMQAEQIPLSEHRESSETERFHHSWDWLNGEFPLESIADIARKFHDAVVEEGLTTSLGVAIESYIAGGGKFAGALGGIWAGVSSFKERIEIAQRVIPTAKFEYRGTVVDSVSGMQVSDHVLVDVTVKPAKQAAFDEFLTAYQTASFSLSATVAFTASTLLGNPLGIFAVVSGLASQGTFVAAQNAWNKAKDPPDPNFTVFVTVQPQDISSLDLNGSFAAATARLLTDYHALREAESKSVDKSDGARLEDEPFWQSEQLLKAARFAAEATHLQTDLIGRLSLLDPLVQQQVNGQATELADIVARDGLPPDLEQTLVDLGWTDEMISQLRRQFSDPAAHEENDLPLSEAFRLNSFTTALQALDYLQEAIELRTNALDVPVREPTAQERAKITQRQDQLMPVFDSAQPSRQLSSEIESYIDDLLDLIIDTNNLDALQGDLEFGLLAQSMFQLNGFAPADIEAFVEAEVLAGNLDSDVANSVRPLLAAARQSVADGNVAAAASELAAVLSILGLLQPEDETPIVESLIDYLNYQLSLLANKDSLLTVRLDGAAPNQLVRRTGNEFEIIDLQTQETIHHGAIADTSLLAFRGSDDVDNRVVADYAAGGLLSPIDGIIINGGTGGRDSLQVTGSPVESVLHIIRANGNHEMHVATVDDTTALYVRQLEEIVDQVIATERMFVISGDSATVEIGEDDNDGDEQYRIRRTDADQEIDFRPADSQIRVIGTPGDDSLIVSPDFPSPVTLDAASGNDQLTGSVFNDLLLIADLESDQVDGSKGLDTLRLNGAGQTLDLRSAAISNIETIDIRGSGNNTLTLDVNEVLDISSTTDVLRVQHDDNDVVNYGDGWKLQLPQMVEGQLLHILTQNSATVQVVNSLAFRNPLLALDTNRDGSVSPLDALIIINRLNTSGPETLPTPTAVAGLTEFFYVDTNGDEFVAPVDVIQIVNALNKPTSSLEGESPVAHVEFSGVEIVGNVPGMKPVKRRDTSHLLSSLAVLTVAPVAAETLFQNEAAKWPETFIRDSDYDDLLVAVDQLFSEFGFATL